MMHFTIFILSKYLLEFPLQLRVKRNEHFSQLLEHVCIVMWTSTTQRAFTQTLTVERFVKALRIFKKAIERGKGVRGANVDICGR